MYTSSTRPSAGPGVAMKKVLLTDDSPDMIELLQLVLANAGYQLLTASDGAKAVEMCLASRPDLVLMDLKMPTLNGFEATRELRSRGFKNPIVVLTGSESEEDRRRAEEAGCDGYIIKTLDMDNVEKEIDRFLADAGGLD